MYRVIRPQSVELREPAGFAGKTLGELDSVDLTPEPVELRARCSERPGVETVRPSRATDRCACLRVEKKR